MEEHKYRKNDGCHFAIKSYTHEYLISMLLTKQVGLAIDIRVEGLETASRERI